MTRPPPSSPLFPTPPLSRSAHPPVIAHERSRVHLMQRKLGVAGGNAELSRAAAERPNLRRGQAHAFKKEGTAIPVNRLDGGEDRKSTRLNSSHGYISYAVFC